SECHSPARTHLVLLAQVQRACAGLVRFVFKVLVLHEASGTTAVRSGCTRKIGILRVAPHVCRSTSQRKVSCPRLGVGDFWGGRGSPVTSILGISAFYHDSAAAVIIDGKIIAAAQEERFTRKKHDPGFPSHAVAYCLREAGLLPADLDYIVFYDKPLTKFERLLETYLAYVPSGLRSFNMAMPLWLKKKLHMRRLIRGELQGTKAPILFTDHHESHAASAFFPSPFDRAAILTLDGVGEWSTATYGIGVGNKITLMDHLQFP